jgi:4-carboxymuconolactone decarboxylase
MGTAASRLKVHIHAALHGGCSPKEIRELFVQMRSCRSMKSTRTPDNKILVVLKSTPFPHLYLEGAPDAE